jgi:ATP-dependent helicase YprA (DUF1998 family)
VGYAEKIFEVFREALQLCQAIIDECRCDAGCPSCVTALPPGVADQELERLLVESNAAVACTRSLLIAMQTGEIVQPAIKYHEIAAGPPLPPRLPDPGLERLKQRLGNANSILHTKRSRVH